jgi:uncharacterized protein
MNLNVLASQPVWYADGLKFTCTQCGNCCAGPPGFVWITTDELNRLAEFFHMTPQKAADEYCRDLGGRWSLRERRNLQGEYECILLRTEQDGRRMCGAYSVRPQQCRTFPFWSGNLESKTAWDATAGRCPGMNQGRHYSPEEIQLIRDASE